MKYSSAQIFCLAAVAAASVVGVSAFSTTTSVSLPIHNTPQKRAGAGSSSLASTNTPVSGINDIDKPTELPDSLVDAAERAANSCAAFAEFAPQQARCRVDFDTTAGDETFPLLKVSTEFMQNFVGFLSYKLLPELQKERMEEVRRVAESRVALQRILELEQQQSSSSPSEEDGDADTNAVDAVDPDEKRYHISVLQSNGRIGAPNNDDGEYDGPIVRVYFPDEGNAALARRDWTSGNGIDLPSCVRFGACGGIRSVNGDLSRDALVFFFCPKASESDMVEEILQKTELAHANSNSTSKLLTVFVNPQLVDMGVTGFGMAGRMLRERLLDGLEGTYYLRTLAWGALTRSWPNAYSLWEEDETASDGGGYTLMRTLPYLPSNPEVEDIYDAVSEGKIQVDGFGNQINRKPPSALDKFGDFVNGMMRL